MTRICCTRKRLKMHACHCFVIEWSIFHVQHHISQYTIINKQIIMTCIRVKRWITLFFWVITSFKLLYWILQLKLFCDSRQTPKNTDFISTPIYHASYSPTIFRQYGAKVSKIRKGITRIQTKNPIVFWRDYFEVCRRF